MDVKLPFFFFLVLGFSVLGFFSLAVDHSPNTVGKSVYNYGSSFGHTYHYETGNSGITGKPDFIINNGLGAVPICFNQPTSKGGFWNNISRTDFDHVQCFVVPPQTSELLNIDRGNLPVHCFLRQGKIFPQGLPHPAVCNLEGKRLRHVYE